MKQKIITLTQVFRDLDRIGNNRLLHLDGEEVIPRNTRVKLIFYDRLSIQEDRFSFSRLLDLPKQEIARGIENDFEEFPRSFVFIYNPTYYDGGYLKFSNETRIKEFSKEFDENTKICIQQDDRKPPPLARLLISTEELGGLICMLYFREKGYIVQEPLRTYGKEGKGKPGVDDIVAWKSSVVDNLRKFEFIGKGCHIFELACLRWLGKVSTPSIDFEDYTTKEILLTEVKSSENKAISNSPQGVNQLLRAKKEKVATKLFISFPFINKTAEEIFAEIKSMMKEGPIIGAILFDSKGIYVQDSETFPHENMFSEIGKYEKNLKRSLLNNFYFDEILEMMRELNLYTKHKGFEEVLREFYKKIEELPADYILEKLDKLI